MRPFPTLAFLLAASVVWANDPTPGGPMEGAAEPATGTAATPVYETTTPLVIDGRLDKPAWRDAIPVAVNVLVGKAGEKSDVPRMTVKYTWDSQYLYIGYETFDTNLVALGTDVRKGPPGRQRQGAVIFQKDSKVDVAEFFVTFGDPLFFWELHHNALNQFNDIWCVTVDPAWPIAKSSMVNYGILFNRQEYLEDDGPNTVAMAVHLKPKADGTPSTINDPSDTDTGYTAEIRLPWKSIGAPSASQTWIKATKTSPRLPGPWKMAGQTMRLLAVVQDGDLKTRYHHSGTGPIPDWFHKAQDMWPRYEFKHSPGSTRTVIEQLVDQDDDAEIPASLVKDASELGIAAALAGAEFLDERKPARAEALHEIMAAVGNSRRSFGEILRLYQPEAFHLFYTPEGVADQHRLAVGLAWKKWPDALPEAMVGIAPVPLIEWLNSQATNPKPAFGKLTLISHSLGWWLRTRSERQHETAFRQAVVALSTNPAIAADPAADAALLHLIADASATGAVDFAMAQCSAPQPEVRTVAIETLGRLAATDAPAGAKSLDAFVRLAAVEQETPVLTRLATASQSWPDEPRVGQAILDVYHRTTDTTLRRAILFAVAKMKWPQRGAIIKAALDEPGGGVVGVALDALVTQPVPELADTIFAMVSENGEAQPPLIDAAGAYGETRFAAPLLRWVKTEQNVGVLLKLALALEKIPGDAASQGLADLLGRTADPFLATQLCHIASRRDLPATVPVLVSLAEDPTAPMPVRGQAVWALGRYSLPTARESLAKLRRTPETFFKSPEGAPLVPETLEQVRLYLALAALRQGDAGAEAEVRQRFADGTPGTQLACLLAFAELKRDDPLIVTGLGASDFAVLQGAVQAAAFSNPTAYRDRLAVLQKSPWIAALLSSGLDIHPLPAAFAYGLRREGEKP